MGSVIVKPPLARRQVATKSGATNIDLGKITIPLPKNRLVDEYILDVQVSQGFAVAPSSSDVRECFSKVELVSDTLGTLVSVPFAQAYDLSRFTEKQPVPVVTLGTPSTARFAFDFHMACDEATLDIITALQTAEHGDLYIELTVSPDAASMFKGGTTPAVAAYQIAVIEKSYPNFSGVGMALDGIMYGRAYQKLLSLASATGGAAVGNFEPLLKTGGKLRFLMLTAYNTAGALPVRANGILDRITSLEIDGIEYMLNVPAEVIQGENEAKREMGAQAGQYVIDFGDDHHKWPSLDNLNEVRLKYSTKATAPASWLIQIAQNSAIGIQDALIG